MGAGVGLAFSLPACGWRETCDRAQGVSRAVGIPRQSSYIWSLGFPAVQSTKMFQLRLHLLSGQLGILWPPVKLGCTFLSISHEQNLVIV